MIQSTVTDSSVRRADSKLSTVKLIARAIPELCSLIYYLVEGWENVVCKLHLSNRCSACASCADSETSDALLRKGRVENAIRAIFLVKAHSAAENAAKLDVFAKN